MSKFIGSTFQRNIDNDGKNRTDKSITTYYICYIPIYKHKTTKVTEVDPVEVTQEGFNEVFRNCFMSLSSLPEGLFNDYNRWKSGSRKRYRRARSKTGGAQR